MKTGTYFDTSEKEYRKWDALNYSRLAAFAESQDHALLEIGPKSYFEMGKAFELLVEDRAKGTNKFGERFFVCDAEGDMPDGLAGWIENKDLLGAMYKLKKDGTRNDRSKRLHSWLDACRDHPGAMPKGKDEMDKLNIMVNNFMKLEVYGHPLEELLRVAEFQVPLHWTVNGIKKKALVDVLLETKSSTYVFDMKSAANMHQFKKMLRGKYWIQSVHSEGVAEVCKDPMPFVFLVSSKQEPYLAQSFGLEIESRWYAEAEYMELCKRFVEWEAAGCPPRGWKEYEEVKVYFN